MRLYFSGWGGEHRPAGLKRRPNFMLTFYDMNRKVKKQLKLLDAFIKRKAKRKANR